VTWLTPIILLFAQAAPAAAPRAVAPEVEAQIPLIADKLQAWRGTWGAVQGKLGCKTTASTGDREIDLIGCQAVLACIRPVYPELKAIADGTAPEADKKARIGAKLATLDTCMKQHRGQGIAELALKRGRG
jgi:hypothetical protein